MSNIKEKETKEALHFQKTLEASGDTWWGNKTLVGKYRCERRAKMAIDFFQPNSEQTILDLGCGVGMFTSLLANYEFKIVGIDITSASIEYAQKIHTNDNISFMVGSAYNIPLEDNSVDFITGNAVLHHFELDKAIPEMLRILKPKGKIAFFEPNMLNPQIYIEKNIKFIGKILQNTEDETAFYKKELFQIFENYNFNEVKVVPFDFMHPIIPGLFLPILKIVNGTLEKTPVIKEISGSLYIYATK